MLSLSNKTKRNSPLDESRFEKIKNYIIGHDYELSLVLIGDQRSQNLNKKYRKKNKPTNILSFPIDKNIGEIFLNLNQIEKQTKKYGLSLRKLTIYLFIHGCLHLKGFKHGLAMEKEEIKLMKKFKSI